MERLPPLPAQSARDRELMFSLSEVGIAFLRGEYAMDMNYERPLQ
jgi:hypothetical protein